MVRIPAAVFNEFAVLHSCMINVTMPTISTRYMHHQGCLQELTSWERLWGGTYNLVYDNSRRDLKTFGQNFFWYLVFRAHHPPPRPGTALCTVNWQSFSFKRKRWGCHTHSAFLVSTILDCWACNFQATIISAFVVHWLWKFTMWLRTCWKNIAWGFLELCWPVLKLCLMSCHFLDHTISTCINIYLRNVEGVLNARKERSKEA